MFDKMIRNSIRWVPGSARDSLRKVPLVAWLQRQLINRFSSNESFNHTIDHGPCQGLVIPITLPQDKELWKGTYEQAFIEGLVDTIPTEAICYDIGGWRGYFSAAMQLNGAAKVFVFEPMPENIAAIETLMALNKGIELNIEPVAIGAENAAASFKVMPDNSMGKLASSPFQPERDGIDTTVTLRTLDSMIKDDQIPPPDIIKIDIEGAELDALNGALDTLSEHHPALFIEVHSDELLRDCSSLLQSHRYLVETLDMRGPAHDRVYHVKATWQADPHE